MKKVGTHFWSRRAVGEQRDASSRAPSCRRKLHLPLEHRGNAVRSQSGTVLTSRKFVAGRHVGVRAVRHPFCRAVALDAPPLDAPPFATMNRRSSRRRAVALPVAVRRTPRGDERKSAGAAISERATRAAVSERPAWRSRLGPAEQPARSEPRVGVRGTAARHARSWNRSRSPRKRRWRSSWRGPLATRVSGRKTRSF